MGRLNFEQMFLYFQILLYIVTRWCVCGVDIFTKGGLPSAIYNPGKTNYKDIYNFNFPKDSVFVFNNPTIINLGDIKDNPKVDGLLFDYLHFYGSYDYVGAANHWYRKEISSRTRIFGVWI